MSFKTMGDAVLGLCNSVLGESISYTPNGDTAVLINAVFDYSYVDVDGVVSLKPVLRVALADLVNPPGKGDLVTIDDSDFSVLESRLDGYGGSSLILKKV